MSDELCYKSRGTIYFPTRKIPQKHTVLKRLGVKRRSFAGGMISRMYDYYFSGAVDFYSEYRRYYSKEYNSLPEFIEEHYNIDHAHALQYAKEHYSMKNCSYHSIERNIETLNYDSEFKTMFSDAVGGILDEDPDGIYYE